MTEDEPVEVEPVSDAFSSEGRSLLGNMVGDGPVKVEPVGDAFWNEGRSLLG